ncbi:hypothetical protein CEXT_229061 [Caerostris extrusa]|uniref:Uncharacterized protein n=1 Tax=Caerostris extrusa TaxID=172846 RepID=A0AAV4QFE6_CAEEX|nr:hypothetical protein CEXT_229061 [Caerostris extrusa]
MPAECSTCCRSGDVSGVSLDTHGRDSAPIFNHGNFEQTPPELAAVRSHFTNSILNKQLQNKLQCTHILPRQI